MAIIASCAASSTSPSAPVTTLTEATMDGAMIPLGSLEAGALASWLGAPFALAFGAVICAIAGLVTLLVIRRREAELSATT